MLRTIWVAFLAIVVTVPLAGTGAVIAVFSSTARGIDWINRTWARILLRAAGVDLRTENIDVIERGRPYVLIANHYSWFDIPCLLAAIPQQPIRFVAKASLFKIPFFGWAIKRAGFIPIDRKNRRTAVQSFDLAAERIRRGNTIVIFPEEGRSRERTMRPFQRGAFLLALKSECPIVPLAIDGTYDVLNAKARRITPGRVTIRAGTPLITEGLTLRDKDGLLKASRAQIHAMLFGRPEDPDPAASAPPE